MSDCKIETKCIQSGYQPKNGEPRVLPIYQSTTYKYDSSTQLAQLFDLEAPGHMYTRISNPTVECVENKISDLEGGVGAMCTSSGQAASLQSLIRRMQTCSSRLHVSRLSLGRSAQRQRVPGLCRAATWSTAKRASTLAAAASATSATSTS